MRFIHFSSQWFIPDNSRKKMHTKIEGTIAYFRNGDTITLGMSFTHPKDNFCKRTGREVANDAFLAAPFSFNLPFSEMTGYEINDFILYMVGLHIQKIPYRPFATKAASADFWFRDGSGHW